MKYSTIISTPAIVMALVLLSSCGKTDTELPTICTQTGVEMSVLNDEIEALAGNVIEITDSFCDNESLSEVRWDVHNAADHAHQEGEEDAIISRGRTLIGPQRRLLPLRATCRVFTFQNSSTHLEKYHKDFEI